MMKPMLFAGAAALALNAGSTMASQGPSPIAHAQARIFVTAPPPGSRTLYDQNKDATGTAVFSQNIEGIDDSQGADDFTIPKGHTWIVKEVDVTGVYFDGSGPATSENVFFYKDNGGLPGDPVANCPNESGTDGGFGSFAIVLSKACKVKLHGGKTYWVSVQANMDLFGGAGEWGWSLSQDTNGNLAAWQDPDGGDCPTWCHLDNDLMFALRGKDRH